MHNHVRTIGCGLIGAVIAIGLSTAAIAITIFSNPQLVEQLLNMVGLVKQ